MPNLNIILKAGLDNTPCVVGIVRLMQCFATQLWVLGVRLGNRGDGSENLHLNQCHNGHMGHYGRHRQGT